MPYFGDIKVGYVVKRYPRYSETFIVNEILAHEAAGLEIEIFSLRPPNDTHFQDIIAQVKSPVNYLPSEGLKASEFWAVIKDAGCVLPRVWNALEKAGGDNIHDVYQAILLAREVYLKGISHLHAHFATVATTVTRLAAYFASVPYTFTAHAKDIFQEGVQRDDLIQKLNDAAAVVTVSDYNLKYLQENYDFSAKRVRRIYNGLDLELFRYKTPYTRPPRIVSVGRIVEKKGFSDLIKACAILDHRACNYSCQIIGTGPLENELRNQIEKLGLQRKVEILGSRPQKEVIRHVQNAAVFAAPCVIGEDGNRDGLPTVLTESMALGTPSVSTDVTGIPEIIEDEKTGLMVPQHDPPALATAIEKLLVNSDLREQIAARARQLIEKEFDIYRNTSSLRTIFQEPKHANNKAVEEI
jgi:colanic acid/amylovoran biosynthesis glycosyltransferase